MEAKSLSAADRDQPGIPLDLAPLVAPHRHHARLSIRIERLPPLSRLSKGHNNGDGTFSLKPDDLDEVYFVPPDGADGAGADLAVRIVKLDDDAATTLDLIDLPVPAGAPAAAPKKRTIRFSGAPKRNKGDKVVQLDAARPEARAAPEPAPADAAGETESLQRAFDVLSKTLAETEARAADAEKQAEEAEARNAAYAARVKAAEAAADKARLEAKAAFDAELAQLRQQLDAATPGDGEDVQAQALEAAAAEHARELDDLQSKYTKDLEQQITATTKALESAFKDRLADALGQAEESAEARLAEARQEWQSKAEAELAAAHEQTKTAGAKEQATATKKLEKAFAGRLADALKQAEEQAKARLAEARGEWEAKAEAEIAKVLERSTADGAKQQAAATKKLEKEFAGRLAEALGEAEEQAAAALASAREAWQAEEAERSAAAQKEFEVELSRLRHQLDEASHNFDDMRQQALDAAAGEHACEIAALEKVHASALEQQIKETESRLETDFAGRLADELGQAGDTAKAELEQARQAWIAEAETNLLSARETWQAEEAARAAAAQKEFGEELSGLRQQIDEASHNFDAMRQQALDTAAAEHAGEVAALESQYAHALEAQVKETTAKLEQEFTERLAEARKQWDGETADGRVAEALREAAEQAEADLEKAREDWQAQAEADLAAAREEWQAEEAERLAAARKEWPGLPAAPEEPRKKWRRPTLPRLQVPLWLPRRSLVIKAAIVGALGLALLHPAVKSRLPAAKAVVAEHSGEAASDLRIYFDPLISKVTGSEPLPEAMPPRLQEEPADIVERATIGVGRANVRTGPSTRAGVLATLDRGSELIVIGWQGSWREVRFGAGSNEIGWIHSDLLGAAP